MNDEIVRVQAKITGRVQGVGFRYFTRGIAGETGVTGWVRNRRDGSVETVAEGSQTQVEQFIRRVKLGPRSGTVEKLIDDWTEGTGEFKTFRVRMTC